MSDPLPTDAASDAQPGAEREAKIEQLLLTGLDHYFDGQYDQAINVWTRALFLDRGHARARAYIERARSALAERQRESEELLQRGLAAFDRGASVEARRLLEAAITRGAPRDEALPVLDRIQRLDPPTGPVARVEDATPEAPVSSAAAPPAVRGWSAVAWLSLSLSVLLGALIAAGLLPVQVTWGRPQAVQAVVPASPVLNDEKPALPRRGERALARARRLAQTGRLRDALLSLDQITMTDHEKPAADLLRADIQRRLMAAALGTLEAADRAPDRAP